MPIAGQSLLSVRGKVDIGPPLGLRAGGSDVAKLEKLNETLQAITALEGVSGAMVVNRGGLVIASKLPKTLHEDAFAAMIATMMGAAQTASLPLGIADPRSVVVDLGSGGIVAMGVGSKGILVALSNDASALAGLADVLSDFRDEVKEIV